MYLLVPSEESSIPPALRQLQANEDRQKRQQQLMEAMAAAAQKLLAAPEDNVSELRSLNALVADKDMGVGSALVLVCAVGRGPFLVFLGKEKCILHTGNDG